jgi:hypothetical protein
MSELDSKVIQDQPEQAAVPPQLGLNDLAGVVRIIDVVSRRGAFEGAELADVGILRNRFATFVQANAPKEEPKADETKIEEPKAE